jgi:hypothetical protein
MTSMPIKSKMKGKLVWRDLQRCGRLDRYILVRKHIQTQYEHLQSLRLRRYDVLEAYQSCLQKSPHSLSTTDLDHWIKQSHLKISSAYELLVADGVKWERKLTNNLNTSVTEICKQSIFSILLFETLQEDDKEINSLYMREFCQHLAEDIDALTKEKFGACPSVVVEGELHLFDIRPSLVHFSLVEFLKNSIYSVIKRYDVLDLDDSEPIVIHLDATNHGIRITDPGIGMRETELKNCFQAFYTTTRANSNPTYQYSRDFGVPFSGAGFGMLKSKVSEELFSVAHTSFHLF